MTIKYVIKRADAGVDPKHRYGSESRLRWSRPSNGGEGSRNDGIQ
jgi:hypothetical protein